MFERGLTRFGAAKGSKEGNNHDIMRMSSYKLLGLHLRKTNYLKVVISRDACHGVS